MTNTTKKVENSKVENSTNEQKKELTFAQKIEALKVNNAKNQIEERTRKNKKGSDIYLIPNKKMRYDARNKILKVLENLQIDSKKGLKESTFLDVKEILETYFTEKFNFAVLSKMEFWNNEAQRFNEAQRLIKEGKNIKNSFFNTKNFEIFISENKELATLLNETIERNFF